MVPEASKIIGLPHSIFTNQDSSLNCICSRPHQGSVWYSKAADNYRITEKVTFVATLQFLHVDDLHLARCKKNLAGDRLTSNKIITTVSPRQEAAWLIFERGL